MPAFAPSIFPWIVSLFLIAAVIGCWRSNKLSVRAQALMSYLIMAVIAILLAIIVPVYWWYGQSPAATFGALLPISDALSYFHCSDNLVHGLDMAGKCANRPIYSIWFSTILASAGGDLQIALIAQGILLAIVTIVFYRHLCLSWGIFPAMAGVALLLSFWTYMAPMTLTEHAGFFFGLLGACFLFLSDRSQRIWPMVLGLALLSIGLNARAGAFFILPALLIWVGFRFGNCRLLALSIAVAAICTGFVLNPALLIAFGADTGTMQSNFSYTFYGVVSGGKGWDYVIHQHPELFNSGLDQKQITSRIYALAIERVINEPHIFIYGILKGFVHYFYKLFQFVEPLGLRFALIALWAVGLIVSLRQLWTGKSLLIICAIVGIVLSAPLITFDGGRRVFIATFGFDAVLIAAGLYWVFHRVSALPSNTPDYRSETLKDTPSTKVALVCLMIGIGMLLAPLSIRASAADGSRAIVFMEPPVCESGDTAWRLLLGRHSPFFVASDQQPSLYPLAITTWSLINRRSKHHLEIGTFENVVSGNGVILARDRQDFDRRGYLRVAELSVNDHGQEFWVCVNGPTSSRPFIHPATIHSKVVIKTND